MSIYNIKLLGELKKKILQIIVILLEETQLKWDAIIY